MDYYVAYHSVDIMGHDYVPGVQFEYRSRKPEKILREAVGSLVWLIVGSRLAKRTDYRLAGVYAPTSVEGDGDSWVVRGWGSPLRPTPVLSKLVWFPAFLRSQGNFSLGFNRLTEPAIIAAFMQLMANPVDIYLSQLSAEVSPEPEFDPGVADTRQRALVSIVRRQGQAGFRSKLLHAYESTCVFSGCAIEPILDAAHIVPYQGAETNHVQNGLLLRTDLHSLFDLGLLAVEGETMKILVSPRLAATEYAQLGGCSVRAPNNPNSAPSKRALDLHRMMTGLAVVSC